MWDLMIVSLVSGLQGSKAEQDVFRRDNQWQDPIVL